MSVERESLLEAVAFHRREAAVHTAIAAAIEDGTFEALMSYETAFVPVSWVASRLHLTPQATNNRLRKLVDRGIARRRRDGAVFVYHWFAKVGAV